MTAPQVKEVGQVYDLLLQTRDGTTLPCRNKDGAVVNVSQVAYVTSIDRNAQGQHEETELQHKDQLIQFGSSNLVDREFDQWPQVSQGDWSGGTLQRVLTGATPITSFGPQSDPTRYWDGLGLLWPITDYVPQQPVNASPDQNEGGALMRTINAIGNGVVSGYITGSSLQNPFFVYAYQQVAAPQNNLLVLQGDGTKTTYTNPPGTVAGGSNVTCDHICALDRAWWLSSSASGVILADATLGAITTDMTIATSSLIATSYPGCFAAGIAGNKAYIAFIHTVAATSTNTLRIVDVTGFTFTNFTDVSLNNTSTPIRWRQLEFLGDNIIVAAVAHDETVILQYSISSNTWSTLARFPVTNSISFCVVGGSLFVLVGNDVIGNAVPNNVDMWLIQGSSAQHVGPLFVQSSNQTVNFIVAENIPTAFGPYAVFSVRYRLGSNDRMAVFAYDTFRGRLFKAADIGPYQPNNTGLDPFFYNRMAVIGPVLNHPFGSSVLPAQWAILAPTLSNAGGALDTSNVQRLLISPSSAAFQPYLQQGVQITSSLIDFTSAQNKLYRQVVVSFSPLPNDVGITVQLDVWLDQDPASLNSSPDFSTGVVAAGSNAVVGQTQLKLLVNKIARKLVYRVTTTGPTTTPTGAVKLQSVVVQAATGWVQTLKLDLAPGAQINSKNGSVWERQSIASRPMVDQVVAYNFLRQLWRLRGGEVAATFPNGDSGNWLIQDIAFDSPKPMAASFRADQQTQYQAVATCKLREDV